MRSRRADDAGVATRVTRTQLSADWCLAFDAASEALHSSAGCLSTNELRRREKRLRHERTYTQRLLDCVLGALR